MEGDIVEEGVVEAWAAVADDEIDGVGHGDEFDGDAAGGCGVGGDGVDGVADEVADGDLELGFVAGDAAGGVSEVVAGAA